MENVSALELNQQPRRNLRFFWGQLRRYENILIFVSGFLFDVATIIRIDAWFDLAIQLGYLLCVTILLLWQHKEHVGLWQPGSRMKRLWHYNVEALYFFYGGLFSNYVVLYFKSTSSARTLGFFALLIILLVVNEAPHVRRLGYRLRLGFYSFCWASFLIYFVPIVVGRMGDGIFLVSMILASVLTWKIAGLLVSKEMNVKAARIRLFWPAGVILSLIALLYFFRLIPPVPLSVQYQGIFHGIERKEGVYVLRAEKAPFTRFWRKDSRPFRYLEGEAVYYFVRIFAPTRFQHDVKIRWEKKDGVSGPYRTTDRIPLQVRGGRSEGFRGFVSKTNFEPGRWRVSAETEDGRTIGTISFIIQKIDEVSRRGWREIRM